MIKCFKGSNKFKEGKHLKKRKPTIIIKNIGRGRMGRKGCFLPPLGLQQSSRVTNTQCFLLYMYIFPHEQ